MSEREREAQWHADIDRLYCTECGHPHSYHVEDRGCTMPLTKDGYRAWKGPHHHDCGCGESDAHKQDRLFRVAQAARGKWLAAQREYEDFTLEIHTKIEARKDKS